MTQDHCGIDIKIIWNKITGTINTLDEEVLEKWLNEDPGNKEYFDKFCSDYNKSGILFKDDPDSTKIAWKVLNSRIIQKKKVARQRRYIASFAIAASIIIFIGFFGLIKRSGIEPVIQKATIQPGTSKAVLILSDGEQININENINFSRKLNGAILESQNTQLVYHSERSEDNITNYNTLVTPRGGEFFVKLSDGTSVWLNSDTKLKYPVVFDKERRVVELTGEAYFDVVQDKECPFIVKTNNQVVEVLGTSFNICSDCGDNTIQTTLVEGEIKVQSDLDAENVVILNPGQQSIYDPMKKMFSVHEVQVEEFVSWREGLFYFREKSLEEMMSALSSWYDINVEFKDSVKASIKFTGVIKRYDNFDQILDLLEKTEEVEFKIDNNNVTVK